MANFNDYLAHIWPIMQVLCLVHTADADKTRLSCLVRVCGVKWVGDSLWQFSVVLNTLETEQFCPVSFAVWTFATGKLRENWSQWNLSLTTLHCVGFHCLFAFLLHTALLHLCIVIVHIETGKWSSNKNACQNRQRPVCDKRDGSVNDVVEKT